AQRLKQHRGPRNRKKKLPGLSLRRSRLGWRRQAAEQGTADDIFDNAQQEYTRNLINSVPGMHLEIGTGH
ncbi:hypothetical protein ACGLFO_07690, partial [Corynebacterium hesseae]|uniref:hypothetical protein n=1 Tax=Corynebacterium hesseae TaxID=2913502 RepID=UPI00373E61F3